MPLTAILCRTGRKRPIRDLIVSQKPKDFTTYTEPFVGTGDIYLALDLDPSIRAVINDLDPIIAQGHKFIKSNPTIPNITKYDMTEEQTQNFVKKSYTNPVDKFVKNLIIMCGSFGGIPKLNKDGYPTIYQFPPMSKKLVKIPAIAEYMKNTTVLQKDYKAVVKQYDSPTTFHYLDPPYENSVSNKLYKEAEMNYEEMAKFLKTIKGKFLLSINDSPNIRNIFRGFKIQKISVKGGAHKTEGARTVGDGNRSELLIKNY